MTGIGQSGRPSSKKNARRKSVGPWTTDAGKTRYFRPCGSDAESSRVETGLPRLRRTQKPRQAASLQAYREFRASRLIYLASLGGRRISQNIRHGLIYAINSLTMTR